VIRVGALSAGVVAAVLLASCGGGSRKPSIYSRAATRSCLTSKHLRLVGPLDFVASTATGGGLKVRLPDNSVTIAFGRTLEDATNINEAYVRFHAKNVGIQDVLRQQGNAVMLWHAHPSDDDAKLIADCLK
jgi:hypothetical protein